MYRIVIEEDGPTVRSELWHRASVDEDWAVLYVGGVETTAEDAVRSIARTLDMIRRGESRRAL